MRHCKIPYHRTERIAILLYFHTVTLPYWNCKLILCLSSSITGKSIVQDDRYCYWWLNWSLARACAEVIMSCKHTPADLVYANILWMSLWHHCSAGKALTALTAGQQALQHQLSHLCSLWRLHAHNRRNCNGQAQMCQQQQVVLCLKQDSERDRRSCKACIGWWSKHGEKICSNLLQLSADECHNACHNALTISQCSQAVCYKWQDDNGCQAFCFQGIKVVQHATAHTATARMQTDDCLLWLPLASSLPIADPYSLQRVVASMYMLYIPNVCHQRYWSSARF